MPQISIIIPTHNRSEILSQTLESVRVQTMPDFECIIVDDHSIDEKTREIARQYAEKDNRFKAYCLPDSKRGGNAARNYGMELSQAQYVNFLDSDDLFTPNKLEVQLAELMKNPNLDMITCRHHWFHQQPGDLVEQLKFAPPQNWLNIVFFPEANGRLWGSCGPIWKKNKLTKINGWNEQLLYLQDPELNIRALLQGFVIERIDRILVFVRVGSQEKISNYAFTDLYYESKRNLFLMQKNLKKSGKYSRLSKFNISERLYHNVKHRFDQKGIIIGILEWISVSLRFSLPLQQVFIGLFLLIAREVGLGKIKGKLSQLFTAYRKSLPPPLPDLDDPFANLT